MKDTKKKNLIVVVSVLAIVLVALGLTYFFNFGPQLSPGSSNPGGWNYCKNNPCNAGEGDCDGDGECAEGECVNNVGGVYGFSKWADVCELKREIPCGNYGDVDGDGWVTTRDSQLILNFLSDEDLINRVNADVSGDGEVNGVDAWFIREYLKDARSPLPVCGGEESDLRKVLGLGDSFTQDGKSFWVDLIGENTARINGETINEGSSKIVDGVKIKLVKVYWNNSKEKSVLLEVSESESSGDSGGSGGSEEVTYEGVLEMLGQCNWASIAIGTNDSATSCNEACAPHKCIGGMALLQYEFATGENIDQMELLTYPISCGDNLVQFNSDLQEGFSSTIPTTLETDVLCHCCSAPN